MTTEQLALCKAKLQAAMEEITARRTECAELRRERDADRADVVKLCQERLQLTAERDEARAAAKRARDVAATMHDISPYDDAECAPGCPGCLVEAAIDGSGT